MFGALRRKPRHGRAARLSAKSEEAPNSKSIVRIFEVELDVGPGEYHELPCLHIPPAARIGLGMSRKHPLQTEVYLLARFVQNVYMTWQHRKGDFVLR
jgi:hypothetical protein